MEKSVDRLLKMQILPSVGGVRKRRKKKREEGKKKVNETL